MIKITEKSKCTGCYACAAICPKACISMQSDEEGFWYPVIEEIKCINCGACEQACPVFSYLPSEKKEDDIIAYAVVHKDIAIRERSSSGGVFTAIASYVIEHGGVVFGAAFDEKFQVKHRYIETMEELEILRGSKYVQSCIGDTYKPAEVFLKEGRKVLFSGTPCQIEGLLTYLKRDYDNLLTQDIICHGVPSPMVWAQYISWQEKKSGSKITSVSFRNKKYGWKQFSMKIGYANSTEYVMPLTKDSYLQAFLKNLCLRPSCYACSFKKTNRKSDFTLADFWGINHILPDWKDDRGTSLVLVNSAKGQKVFRCIEDSIAVEKVDMSSAVQYNIALTHSVPLAPKREEFMKVVRTDGFEKAKEAFLDPTFMQCLIRKGKELLKRLLRMVGK